MAMSIFGWMTTFNKGMNLIVGIWTKVSIGVIEECSREWM